MICKRKYKPSRAASTWRSAAAASACGLALTMVGGALLLSPGNRTAIAQGYGLTLQQLATRLSAVESKTQYMSANPAAKSTTFSGCNVYVQNGLGATSGNPKDPGNPDTAVTNGLGNLIIGYNQAGHLKMDFNTGLLVPNDVRTGSHNLILGDKNNYSSFGGLVAGQFNAVSGSYAAVVGGSGGEASGYCATVSGGLDNIASGSSASVSGGAANVATGQFASVSGGINNFAGNTYASVSGGIAITQSARAGWSAGSLGTQTITGNFLSP